MNRNISCHVTILANRNNIHEMKLWQIGIGIYLWPRYQQIDLWWIYLRTTCKLLANYLQIDNYSLNTGMFPPEYNHKPSFFFFNAPASLVLIIITDSKRGWKLTVLYNLCSYHWDWDWLDWIQLIGLNRLYSLNKLDIFNRLKRLNRVK